MSKVITFAMLITGFWAILTIFGLADSTTSQLLQLISFDNISAFTVSQFFSILFSDISGIITAFGAIGGVVIGYLGRSKFDLAILAPFLGVMAGWIIGDTIGLILRLRNIGGEISFIADIMLVVFGILLVGFMLSLPQWWRGSD